MFLSLFCNYFALETLTGVFYAAFLGFLGWLGKIAYERNGCFKRLEQKVDDLIDRFDNHLANNNIT